MPNLKDASNPPGDVTAFVPVDPVSSATAPTPIVNEQPGFSPLLRSPLPGINASPDSLRQFYRGSIVPQSRVVPPTVPTYVPPNNTTITTNVTEVVAAPASSAGATTTDLASLLLQTPTPAVDVESRAILAALLLSGAAGSSSVAVLYDALANRPASADPGTLFYANDNVAGGYTLYIYDGSQWVTPTAYWQAATDGVNAAQWANHAGTVILNLDTTNKRFGINVTTPDQDLHVLGSIAFAGNHGGNTQTITSSALTGSRTFTLPDANSNSVQPSAAPANKFATEISSAGVITWTQPSASNLSDGTTGTGSVVLKSVTDALAGQFGSIAGTTLTLAKITLAGSDGSITLNSSGCCTAYVAAT